MTQRWMLRDETFEQLLSNHKQQHKGTRAEVDYFPAVKVFLPWTSATFLISECDEDGLAFGLSDLGFGSPELGYISMDEIWEVKGPGGLQAEEDLHFKADKRLTEYAAEARAAGRITA